MGHRTCIDVETASKPRRTLPNQRIDRSTVAYAVVELCVVTGPFCVHASVCGALAHGYPVTLVSDAHTTLDNGVLSAAQISAHHNATLANMDSFGPRATTIAAADLRLAA